MALVSLSCPLAAQNQPEPKLWSLDITPQVGFRTSMNFLAEPGIDGVRPQVRFREGRSIGFGFGVRYNDEDVVEFRWAQQDTQVQILGPLAVPFTQHVILNQFHLDCSHEYVVDEWPPWARPFILASVGATHISSTASTIGFTRFSFGIGGGIKVFPSRHVGLKLQAEWLPLWIQPEVQAYCRYGCIIHFTGQIASQGEVTIGPVLRF